MELFFSGTGCPDGINVQVNHLTQGYRYGLVSGGVSGGGSSSNVLASFRGYGQGILVFYAPHPQGKVGCVTISSNGNDSFSGQQCAAPCTWRELTSFNFSVYQGAIPAGSKLVLCGVKL